MIAGNPFLKAPMWEGSNTQQYPEPTKKHAVCYIQIIRPPQTREHVVKETLTRSQAVAKAGADKYAFFTYGFSSCENCKTNSDSKFSRI